MRTILITICLLLFAGCNIPKPEPYQGVQFPTLAQMQGRFDRKSVLKGLQMIMNDPAMYRVLEIKIQNLGQNK